MKVIITADDLLEARSVPRALILLWVKWAVQVRQSEATLKELISFWQLAFAQHPIPVYRADLSD